MSVGEQPDEQVFNQLFLSDDHLPHFQGQHVHESAFLLDAIV